MPSSRLVVLPYVIADSLARLLEFVLVADYARPNLWVLHAELAGQGLNPAGKSTVA